MVQKGEVSEHSNKYTSAVVKSGDMSYHPVQTFLSNTPRSPENVQRIVVIDQNHIDNLKFKVNTLQG